jgi:hypothetical protein
MAKESSKAIADGKITRKELEAVEKEAHELFMAVTALVHKMRGRVK